MEGYSGQKTPIPTEILVQLVDINMLRQLCKYTREISTEAFICENILSVPTESQVEKYILANEDKDVGVVFHICYGYVTSLETYTKLLYTSTHAEDCIMNVRVGRGANRPRIEIADIMPAGSLILYNDQASDAVSNLFRFFGSIRITYNEPQILQGEYTMVDIATVADIMRTLPVSQFIIESGQGEILNECIKEFCMYVVDHTHAHNHQPVWQAAIVLYMHCKSLDIYVDPSDIANFISCNTDETLTDADMDIFHGMYAQLCSKIKDMYHYRDNDKRVDSIIS